jgi:hypothetical protein
VLSTLRRAYDLDYRCVVLKDTCYDADAEVHNVTGDVGWENEGRESFIHHAGFALEHAAAGDWPLPTRLLPPATYDSSRKI